MKAFRQASLAVAIASTVAGAIIAILPALIVAIVNLFYDSAGGVLILLGSLITLLPHPAVAPAGSGGSSLPTFQTLDTHVGLVLLRSLGATVLCSVAFAAIAGQWRPGRRTPWPTVAGCSLGAAVIAGHATAIALSPAIAISVFHLARAARRIAG